MAGEGKKGTCGATKIAGLTKKSRRNCLQINFNEVRAAIGQNKGHFVSYVGMMIQIIMCIF